LTTGPDWLSSRFVLPLQDAATMPTPPTAEVIGIDHIYLAVSDLARAQAWYDTVLGEVLGFRCNRFEIGGDPHVQYYNRQFGIVLRPARSSRSHDPYAPGLHHLCLRVDSVAEVRAVAEQLRSRGIAASPAQAHAEYAPDYWATFFEDPDGVRLEVTNYRQERRDRHDHWDRAGNADGAPAGVALQVIDRPAVTLACLRHTGPYGAAVGEFWRQRFGPWLRAQGLEGRSVYGIGHDDPSTTEPGLCRYDACVAVAPGQVAGDGAFLATLPAGPHAVRQFLGTPAQIGPAWGAFFAAISPGSGWRVALGSASPCFEHYPPDAPVDPATGEFGCELCIPVAPERGTTA